MAPEAVRDHMEAADIFLFTSDFNEGWGAVLNESMNSACAVVASHAIGSVPFLLKDGENGFIQTLLEMYAETVNVLTDNKPADEGNVATWKVIKN
jgi:glycosyltransferase involved in cell wall biosynthesis